MARENRRSGTVNKAVDGARKSMRKTAASEKASKESTAIVPSGKKEITVKPEPVKGEIVAVEKTEDKKEKKTAPKKETAKKEPPKKAAQQSEVAFETYVELDGEQINVSQDSIRSKIEAAYKADGHRIGNIKTVQVYINLNERRAYYVINGKPEDKFVEL